MAKIACLLGPEFEDSEFQVPYERLARAGHQIDVIGTSVGEVVEGKKGKVKAKIELSIDVAEPDAYDLLFIPGGHSPDHLRADERFVDFVKAFEGKRKPIAAICHGAQLLMSARIVRGRTLTAWKTIQDDLAQMGAHVLDEPVVRDGTWITSRKPEDLDAFTEAILSTLDREVGASAPM